MTKNISSYARNIAAAVLILPVLAAGCSRLSRQPYTPDKTDFTYRVITESSDAYYPREQASKVVGLDKKNFEESYGNRLEERINQSMKEYKDIIAKPDFESILNLRPNYSSCDPKNIPRPFRHSLICLNGFVEMLK